MLNKPHSFQCNYIRHQETWIPGPVLPFCSQIPSLALSLLLSVCPELHCPGSFNYWFPSRYSHWNALIINRRVGKGGKARVFLLLLLSFRCCILQLLCIHHIFLGSKRFKVLRFPSPKVLAPARGAWLLTLITLAPPVDPLALREVAAICFDSLQIASPSHSTSGFLPMCPLPVLRDIPRVVLLSGHD